MMDARGEQPGAIRKRRERARPSRLDLRFADIETRRLILAGTGDVEADGVYIPGLDLA